MEALFCLNSQVKETWMLLPRSPVKSNLQETLCSPKSGCGLRSGRVHGILQSFSGWGALCWPNSTRLKQRLREPGARNKGGRPAAGKAGGPGLREVSLAGRPDPGLRGGGGCAPYRRTLPSLRSGAWTPLNDKPSHFFQILSSLQKHVDLLVSSSAGGGSPGRPLCALGPPPALCLGRCVSHRLCHGRRGRWV